MGDVQVGIVSQEKWQTSSEPGACDIQLFQSREIGQFRGNYAAEHIVVDQQGPEVGELSELRGDASGKIVVFKLQKPQVGEIAEAGRNGP